MKQRKQQLLTGASALLLVILGALFLMGGWDETTVQKGPGEETTDSAVNLQWRAGSSQQYDVLVDSSFEMTMPGASSGQSMAVKVDGILDYQTLEVGPTEVLVGMRFSAMEMSVAGVTNAAVNDALTQPFRVHMTVNGSPRSFEFPAAFSGEHREVIENLLRMFQLVIENGNTWVVQESNASGAYEAAYTRNSPSTLVKKKVRFLSSAASTVATPPEVVSDESISIDVSKDWIDAMTIDETVTSTDLSGPSIVVINHASLKLRDKRSAALPEKWDFASAVTPDASKQLATAKVPAISQEVAERQLLAGIGELDAAVKGRSILIHSLRDLLLVDEKMPFVLLELMKVQQLSDRTRADLYLVFELAGTPQAQAALTSVFTDQSWSQRDGKRAIVALGGLENPTEETLAALWGSAHSGKMGGDHDGLPSTAALALGSLGRALNTTQSENYSSLRSGLLDGASSAADTHQRAVFLHALGNTGDPDLSIRNNVVSFLSDAAAEVRAAAAKTLGRLGTSQVAGPLLHTLEHEQNDLVRGSITGALTKWEDPSLAAIESFRANIRDERDDSVRYNMAVLLGKSMETFPENRIVLKQLLGDEQSKRIRQQVAEMLYAPK